MTTETQNSCFQALDLVQMGTICLAASGSASTFSQSYNNGLQFNGQFNEVGNKLELCLPWFDALCLTGTGISISHNFTLDDSTFKKNEAKYKIPC